MLFVLSAWCTADSSIRKTHLVVRKAIGDSELDAFRQHLPCYGVVSLQVGLVEHSDFDSAARPQALLHQIVTSTNCPPELLQIAHAPQQPSITEGAQFGSFTLDRRLGWHEAHTHWGDCPVRLSLDSGDEEETFSRESLNHARRLWSELPQWNRDVRSAIVNELLELKNDSWLEEDEKPLSVDEFWGRLSLESIIVFGDGSFEFWFDDGGTFRGHSIMASGSFDEGINDAGIHG